MSNKKETDTVHENAVKTKKLTRLFTAVEVEIWLQNDVNDGVTRLLSN